MARLNYKARGSILVEAAIAAAILMIISVMTTSAIVRSVESNRYAAISSMVDALLDYETAKIRRAHMDEVLAIRTDQPTHKTVEKWGNLYGDELDFEVTYIRSTQDYPDLGIASHTITYGVQYSIAGRDYVRTRPTVRHEVSPD